MAKLELDGLDMINDVLAKVGVIPDSVRTEALEAMAAVGMPAVKSVGQAMGVRDPDPEVRVHILDKISHTKPKKTDSGGYTDVTFSGTRTRGRGKKTRNAAIAYINEYGKRNQPARPFIATAAEQAADQITAAGEKIIGEWFEKIGT